VSGEGTDFEALSRPPDSGVGDAPGAQPPARRRERGRLLAATGIGAVVTAFALLNLSDVKVHWLFATGRTPLIVVIALAFVLGMLVDRLVIRARRKRGR
jgi:uncharacterized integral membrane protein